MAEDNMCPLADQRGYERPIGARCDSGAFEGIAAFSSPRVRYRLIPEIVTNGEPVTLEISVENPNAFPLTGISLEQDLEPFLVASSPDVRTECTSNVQATALSYVLRIGDIDLAPQELCIVQLQILLWQFVDHFDSRPLLSAEQTGTMVAFSRIPFVLMPRSSSSAALSLQGSNILYSTRLDYSLPEFTVSLWFKTRSARAGALMGFGDRPVEDIGYRDRVIYLSKDGRLVFGMVNNLATPFIAISTESYNDDVWHHVTATFSRDVGMKLFVDGQLVGENGFGFEPSIYLGWWKIGYAGVNGWFDAPANNHFDGELDEIAVWNRALTPQEIGNNMTRTLKGSEAGLVAYWRLDEGFGSVAYSGTVMEDTLLSVNQPAWAPSTTPILDIVPIMLEPSGLARLQFLGMEGLLYRLQSSLNLLFWSNVTEQIAQRRGLLEFTFNPNTSSLQNFFRVIHINNPKVYQLRVTNVTSTSAAFLARARPRGNDTTAFFQYGTGGALDLQTPAQMIGDGGLRYEIYDLVSNLIPGQEYCFRAVVSNVLGVAATETNCFLTPTAARTALDFASIDNICYTSILQTSPQEFTVTLWFKTANTKVGLMGFSYGETADRHIYMNAQGQILFGVYSNGAHVVKSPGSYNDDQWHHVAVTFLEPASNCTWMAFWSAQTPPLKVQSVTKAGGT
jgi:hypothetical protein